MEPRPRRAVLAGLAGTVTAGVGCLGAAGRDVTVTVWNDHDRDHTVSVGVEFDGTAVLSETVSVSPGATHDFEESLTHRPNEYPVVMSASLSSGDQATQRLTDDDVGAHSEFVSIGYVVREDGLLDIQPLVQA